MPMRSNSWVGGADFTDASGRKSRTTWPLVRLSLDDQGGRLHLSATSGILGSLIRWAYNDEPDIRFAWSEVQEVQRERPTLVPEESVYFRLRRSGGEVEEFVFSAGTNRNDEILNFAESSGAPVKPGTRRPLIGFR
jgi:hypothetical protein